MSKISCNTSHQIVVINLKDGEIIHHELLLIKGFISNVCDYNQISIKEEKTNSTKQFVISQLNGEFKALWKLSPGSNNFIISFCQNSLKIGCIYEELNTEYKIQPLYLICKGHNGCFNNDDSEKNDSMEACKKITLGLKLVQTIFSEKISEHGYPRKTFKLNSDCLPFESNLDMELVKKLDEKSLWNQFAYEIINSEIGDNEKLKFVAFIGCTEYQGSSDHFVYSNIRKHVKAYANIGVGGLALFGSACLYSWPSEFKDIISYFGNKQKIDINRFLDDSNYRGTYGGCYATTIGAICHEIGHIFDLGHTKNGIMGNGFDYINLVFTVNNLTEYLPDRIVTKISQTKDKRLTNFRKFDNYLNKYHEQKFGDSTHFSKECAIILFHHKWLHNYEIDKQSEILFDSKKLIIKSESSKLRMIQIRNKTDALVIFSLDFSNQELNYITILNKMNLTEHNIFVITDDGTTKLFR